MPQSQMLKEQVEAIGETSLDASAPVTKAPEYGGHTTQRTAVIIGPILADGVLAPNRLAGAVVVCCTRSDDSRANALEF
jgi:hypothetical protein